MTACQAITNYKTKAKCGKRATVDSRRVCTAHKKRAVDGEVQCQGKQTKYPTLDCPNKARDGSKYCMRQHNPDQKYVNPLQFRKPNLRSNKETVKQMIKDQKSKDVYLGLDLPKPKDYQVEHVEECQMVAAKFGKVEFKNKSDEKKTIIVLHAITNGRGNLRLVASWANYAKERAVEDFLDDWCKRVRTKPFADYLENVQFEGNTFSPKQIKMICREMEKAMENSRVELRDSKDKLPDGVYYQLKKLHKSVVDAMQLKTITSKKSSDQPSSPSSSNRQHSSISPSKKKKATRGSKE